MGGVFRNVCKKQSESLLLFGDISAEWDAKRRGEDEVSSRRNKKTTSPSWGENGPRRWGKDRSASEMGSARGDWAGDFLHQA